VARVGIREVATLAEVSNGTVSHYLNHPSRVSPQKRERIQKAIDQLGFVRNNAAWQLRLGRSGTIAYIAPDVSNPYFATIAEGVEQRAATHDLAVFLSNSNRSRAREDTYLDMFEAQQVQGMLVASHEPIEDRLTQIRERGIPSVLVGQRAMSDAQPSVSVDDFTGGYMAMSHLIELGRKRIAFVGGPLGIRQVIDRLDGSGKAVREAGDVTLEVLNVTNRTIADGREVARALVARPASSRPDAIFAVNDLLALGLLQSLVAAGVRVPEDIAIVGYDDIEYAESSLIPLTTVRAPHEGFGFAAVDLLVNEMAAEPTNAPKQVVFQPELVIRASTRGL